MIANNALLIFKQIETGVNDMENTAETDELSKAEEAFELVKDIFNKAEYLPEEKRLEAFELLKEVMHKDYAYATYLLLVRAVMAVSKLAKYLPQQQQIEVVKLLKNINTPPTGGLLRTAALMGCHSLTRHLLEKEGVEPLMIAKRCSE